MTVTHTCMQCRAEYETPKHPRARALCSLCYFDAQRLGMLDQYPDASFWKDAHSVAQWLLAYHPALLGDALAEYGLDALVRRCDALVAMPGSEYLGECFLCPREAEGGGKRRLCTACYFVVRRENLLHEYPTDAYWNDPAAYAGYIVKFGLDVLEQELENYTPHFVFVKTAEV